MNIEERAEAIRKSIEDSRDGHIAASTREMVQEACALVDRAVTEAETIRFANRSHGAEVLSLGTENYLRKALLALRDAWSFLAGPSPEPKPAPPALLSGGPGAAPPDHPCERCVSYRGLTTTRPFTPASITHLCGWKHENQCGPACSDYMER